MESAEQSHLCALGVISGTSMGGIDVALVTTDGRDAVVPGKGANYPYPIALRDELLRSTSDRRTL
jgi:anhydro-N-acetylmuramic acid kinase